MAAITSQGIGSGLDIGGLVSQLVAAERQPAELRIARQEARAQAKLSAYGSLKSALSAFNDQLEKLKKPDAMLIRTVASADDATVTASVDGEAVPASYEIEVIQLATVQRLESGAFASSDTGVGTGTLTISLGAASFNLEIDSENNTLAGIRDAINGATDNTGVTATIINSDAGSYLILAGGETGSDQSITVTQSGGDGGLTALEYDPVNGLNSLSETQAAVDAQVRINGLTVTGDKNTVADAIDGVTLTLVAASTGSTTTVTVENDLDAVRQQLDDFVDQHNRLIEAFDNLTRYDPETREAGPLLGDSAVRGVRNQLRRVLTESVKDIDATFGSLLDIGIETDLDGRLSIDSAKLDAVLDAEFAKLGQLFASSDGYAVRLADVVDRYLDATDGVIKSRTDGLDASIERLNEQRQRLEQRMVTVEARLQRQFNALDTLIGQLTTTSNFLTEQLAALPRISVSGE